MPVSQRQLVNYLENFKVAELKELSKYFNNRVTRQNGGGSCTKKELIWNLVGGSSSGSSGVFGKNPLYHGNVEADGIPIFVADAADEPLAKIIEGVDNVSNWHVGKSVYKVGPNRNYNGKVVSVTPDNKYRPEGPGTVVVELDKKSTTVYRDHESIGLDINANMGQHHIGTTSPRGSRASPRGSRGFPVPPGDQAEAHRLLNRKRQTAVDMAKAEEELVKQDARRRVRGAKPRV